MTIRTLYLEDFTIGQKFTSGPSIIDERSIQEFATQFDPQPFHTNIELAKDSFFKSLVASGWHTAGIAMRLLVESDLKPAGGLIGAGIDQLKWPMPVYPGDKLFLNIEVVEVRRSKSNPDNGIVKVKSLTKNQNDQTVMSYIATLIVKSESIKNPSLKDGSE
jgi:acyl dehydratase